MTTTESPERGGLPPMPWRIKRLPVDARRGIPIPWFVARADGDGPVDFRVADLGKLREAVKYRLCWMCGKPLGSYLAFPIGPMCAINRTTSEPPNHRECAEWAIQACPFLNQTEKRRRPMTDDRTDLVEAVGYAIVRQPGVTLLWVTKQYRVFRPHAGNDGILLRIGDPTHVSWWRKGRPATRAEILESIDGGYPSLLALAEEDGPKAVQLLEAARDRAMRLLPQEEDV
jgi:hypothetical protein